MSDHFVVIKRGPGHGGQPFVCEWNAPPGQPLRVQRGDRIVFKTGSGVPEEMFFFVAVQDQRDPATVFSGAGRQAFPISRSLVVRSEKSDVPDGTEFRWAVTDDSEADRADTLARFPGGNGQASGPN